MASTIVRRETAQEEMNRPAQPAPAVALFPPVLALGLTLVGVALIDHGLSWLPLRLGSAEWEFGTISRTFDGLALGTIGMMLITCAAVLRNSAVFLRALAFVLALLFAFLLASAFVYALSAMVALAATPPEAASLVRRAVARTSAFAVLYLVLYGWAVWFIWRRAGAAKGGVAT